MVHHEQPGSLLGACLRDLFYLIFDLDGQI